MNWQQFLPLLIVLVAVVLFVWRSSGKKSGGCGCQCGCSHEPDSPPKKENAARCPLQPLEENPAMAVTKVSSTIHFVSRNSAMGGAGDTATGRWTPHTDV